MKVPEVQMRSVSTLSQLKQEVGRAEMISSSPKEVLFQQVIKRQVKDYNSPNLSFHELTFSYFVSLLIQQTSNVCLHHARQVTGYQVDVLMRGMSRTFKFYLKKELCFEE